MLHVPVSTIHEWARTGRLPSSPKAVTMNMLSIGAGFGIVTYVFGLGMAAAVAVHAMVVRSLLVPAVMSLEANQAEKGPAVAV